MVCKRATTTGETSSFVSADVDWTPDRWILARVWRQHNNRWKWTVWIGATGDSRATVVETGECTTEGVARTAAKRRITPLYDENRKRFPGSERVAQLEAQGYERRDQ